VRVLRRGSQLLSTSFGGALEAPQQFPEISHSRDKAHLKLKAFGHNPVIPIMQNTASKQ